MAKQAADDFISPANLWGKPLPSAARQIAKAQKEKAPRMRTEDEDEIDSDVDAELEEDVVEEDVVEESEDDAAAYAEAEVAESEEEPADEDEDETEFAAEEGDEDGDETEAVAEEEDVDSAVEIDDEDSAPVKVKAGASTKRMAKMSEKKSGADHIRDEIERRQNAGDSLRGVDIVSALAKKKVTVSPAQVSQLLKKAGVKSAKGADAGERSRVAAKTKKKTSAEAPRTLPKRSSVAAAPSKTTMLPMNQLKAASEFIAACDGNYATAEEILTAHKQLGAMMAR
jgi:hypothetical protein